MADPRKPIFDIVRNVLGKVTPQMVLSGDEWLDSIGFPRATLDPAWLIEGRARIGEREIPGPVHNNWIARGWARLGAPWYANDETPWCGFFIAHCIEAAGLPLPKRGSWAAALTWASYGEPCDPQVGAIGVKKRRGGNHVFFIIGETGDERCFKVLHGNASNMVCIGDIPKVDVFAVRWPGGPEHRLPLPVMRAGTISRNEA